MAYVDLRDWVSGDVGHGIRQIFGADKIGLTASTGDDLVDFIGVLLQRLPEGYEAMLLPVLRPLLDGLPSGRARIRFREMCAEIAEQRFPRTRMWDAAARIACAAETLGQEDLVTYELCLALIGALFQIKSTKRVRLVVS